MIDLMYKIILSKTIAPLYLIDWYL